MTQLERLKILCAKLKIPVYDYQKALFKMRDILINNPEYDSKIFSVVENEIFATSRRDIVIYLELDRVKHE